MKHLVTFAAFLLAVLGAPALAQSIDGQWQGTLVNAAGATQRYVVKIEQAANGALSGDIYSINSNADPTPVDGLSLNGATLKFSIRQIASYEGTLSADRRIISGTYTQTRSQPLILAKATPQTAWVIDPSPHTVSFVTTSGNVKLEVLDWGGAGRPLVLLAGLGSTAHTFDRFVPQLSAKYRVYAITRRGWGASDKPDPARASYTSDRLGDDVLDVIDKLKIEKPVLIGWSMGGAELSSIASRYPEKVSGLIYLDAGYAYAYYAPGTPLSLGVQANDLKAKVDRITSTGVAPAEAIALIDDLVKTSLPLLQTEIESNREFLGYRAALPQPAEPQSEPPPSWAIADAIMAGSQRYSDLKDVPILAIFASPQAMPPNAAGPMLAASERQAALQVEVIKRFEAGNPTARVVRIANAQHAVFNSHPGDVLREMTMFIDGLK